MRSLYLLALVSVLSPAALAGNPTVVVLDVQNMTCGLCPVTVRKSLEKVPGVSDAKVDFKARTATVTFDAERTAAVSLVKATTDAGFPSTVRK